MKVIICIKVVLLNKIKIIILKCKNIDKYENLCLLWNIWLIVLGRLNVVDCWWFDV